jgi:recombination protein RecT
MTDQKNLPEKIDALLSRADIRKRFEDMLGKKAAGFMSSILSITNQSKELQVADPKSILSAAAIAASLDLPINPNLGFAHIIPYKGKDGTKAQFQMGWKGFVQLAQRSAQYRTINVSIVCEGELVKHDKFTGETEFNQNTKKSDKVIGYVAYFRLLSGFEKYLFMSHEDAMAHGKRYSKSFANPNSPWQTMFDIMSMKTVTKLLLAKWGPLSIDMQMQLAMRADQAIIKETDSGEREYDYADGKEDIIDADTPPEPDPELLAKFDSMVMERNVDHELFDPWFSDLAKVNEKELEVFKETVMKEKDLTPFWQEYDKYVLMCSKGKEKSGLLFGKKK